MLAWDWNILRSTTGVMLHLFGMVDFFALMSFSGEGIAHLTGWSMIVSFGAAIALLIVPFLDGSDCSSWLTFR